MIQDEAEVLALAVVALFAMCRSDGRTAVELPDLAGIDQRFRSTRIGDTFEPWKSDEASEPRSNRATEAIYKTESSQDRIFGVVKINKT
jgi:hypothetical protein